MHCFIYLAGFVGSIGGRSGINVEVNDTQSGVLFISSFVESAILTAIELHAQKSGYLNIQVSGYLNVFILKNSCEMYPYKFFNVRQCQNPKQKKNILTKF